MTFSLRKLKVYWPFLLLLLLGLYNAYGNAFMQDDAYISYNYAKWFSRGFGLVWYPGSSEFGYTNFLYTFMIGIAMLFRVPPEIASNIINVASFIGALVVTYAIACRILGHRLLALFPIVLLVTNHTFTAYATGGLETMWVTLLVLTFYWHMLTRNERGAEDQHWRLGTIAAILLLTRLDSAVLLLPGYVFLFYSVWPHRAMRQGLAIPISVTLGLLLCCYIAYGYALPNTFYIKMPDNGAMLLQGLHYLILYNALQLYLPFFVPCLLLYFFVRGDSLRRIGKDALLIASVLLIWLSYILYIGGDFMEFRLLVPVLPFYYLVIFRIIMTLLPKWKMMVAFAITLAFLLGNVSYANLFTTKPDRYDMPPISDKLNGALVETTEGLNEWLHYKKMNWQEIGRGLHKLFRDTPDIRIATTAVGAVAFHSDMQVFDLHGMNTRAVNIWHEAFLSRAGHTIKASDALIKQENVHLNIGHPQAVCLTQGWFEWVDNGAKQFLFNRHQTLLLPLSNGCFVVADYVTPHPAIEALIAQRRIIRYRTVMQRSHCPPGLCLK